MVLLFLCNWTMATVIFSFSQPMESIEILRAEVNFFSQQFKCMVKEHYKKKGHLASH